MSTWLSKFTGIRTDTRKATERLRGSLVQLRTEIDDRRRDLDRQRALLPPREELIANAERLVDETGQAWARDHGTTFLQQIAGHLTRAQIQSGGATTLAPVPELPFSTVEPVPFGAACFFLAAEWKAALRAAVLALPYEAGAPTADRGALLEKLGREVAELERLEEETVDDMNEGGIQVAHREEVQARRIREQREQARREEERREREVMERMKADGRAGTPRYITAGRGTLLRPE